MPGPLDFDALVVGPCMESFGEPITFLPAQGTPLPINAVFTEKFTESRFVAGDEVIDTKTMVGCQASQFNGTPPLHNDGMMIRGRLWRITEVLDDGHGHIHCCVALVTNLSVIQPETPPTYAAA